MSHTVLKSMMIKVMKQVNFELIFHLIARPHQNLGTITKYMIKKTLSIKIKMRLKYNVVSWKLN